MKALNDRGKVLCQIIGSEIVKDTDLFDIQTRDEHQILGTIKASSDYFPEEERSKQPSKSSDVHYTYFADVW